MTTRRDFLKAGANAAAGIVFCGCGLVHNANAQPSRQKLPVSVDGKRVIDGRRTHHLHVVPDGSHEIDDYLAIRDYLRAHPAEVDAYGTQKRLSCCFRGLLSGASAGAPRPLLTFPDVDLVT